MSELLLNFLLLVSNSTLVQDLGNRTEDLNTQVVIRYFSYLVSLQVHTAARKIAAQLLDSEPIRELLRIICGAKSHNIVNRLIQVCSAKDEHAWTSNVRE